MPRLAFYKYFHIPSSLLCTLTFAAGAAFAQTSDIGPDTDADGMPDDWEITFNLDPEYEDSQLDLDADGLSNLEEFQQQTNPGVRDTDGDGVIDGFQYGSVVLASLEANSSVEEIELSANGRFVAYSTRSSNLVSGSDVQVYVTDIYTGETELISVGYDGAPGNNDSESIIVRFDINISADGRFVLFGSTARNLVQGEDDYFNGFREMYLRDRVLGTTELIKTRAPNEGPVGYFRMSDNGRYVLFQSYSRSLTEDAASERGQKLFVYDRVEQSVQLVRVNSPEEELFSGVAYPEISADGKFVAFSSYTRDQEGNLRRSLRPILHNRETGQTQDLIENGQAEELNQIFGNPGYPISNPRGRFHSYVQAISGDGNVVLYRTNQGSGNEGLFAYNRLTDSTELLGFYPNLTEVEINHDGSLFVYHDRTDGRNYVMDIATREVLLIGQSNSSETGQRYDERGRPAISSNGEFVAFLSYDRTLTPGMEEYDNVLHVYVTRSNLTSMVEQTFELNSDALTPGRDTININFNDYELIPYSGDNPSSGAITLEDDGNTLRMQGNRWQAIALPYTITPNTVLELDYRADVIAEIQGIGFDVDTAVSGPFRLSGTQSFGSNAYQYNGSGEYQHFVINVGEFITGDYNYLFFAGDDDANIGGDIRFSNIQIYESDVQLEAYYAVTGQETWSSLAAALYGDEAVADQLQTLLEENYTLAEGERILESDLPETLSVVVDPYDAPAPTSEQIEPFQFTVNENEVIYVDLPLESGEPRENLTYQIGTEPTGSYLLEDTGRFGYAYVPSQVGESLLSGETTQDEFTYTVEVNLANGQRRLARTGLINVVGVNDVPYARDDSASTNEDTPLTLSVNSLVSDDLDMDSELLSISGVSNALNGTVELNQETQEIIFTPEPGFFGQASFEYTVTDGEGEDIGLVTINVREVIEVETYSLIPDAFIRASLINFNEYELQSYSGDDPETGSVTVEDDGVTLRMQGNRWQAIEFPYALTANTMLEFDYQVIVEAEIQGIGFDTDTALSGLFRLSGSQSYGSDAYTYTGDGEYQHFTIPVGEFQQGEYGYLFFAGDDDENVGGDIRFSNVQIYEADVLVIDAYYELTEALSWEELAELFYGTPNVSGLLRDALENNYDLEPGTRLLQRDFPGSFTIQP